MALTFFTIGHSTRPLAEFVDLLKTCAVTRVVDIRTVPRSRTNPQYNRETLPEALGADDIDYIHLAELGGLRKKQPGIAPDENAFWINQSFHYYADYATTPAFRAGLATLRELGAERCCAIMCSEAVWWRCHRRIVADYLLNAGESVFHILGAGHVDPAQPTPAARQRSPTVLIYPAIVDLAEANVMAPASA